MNFVKKLLGQNQYNTLKKCVACGNKDLDQFLDLKKQPLANNYHNGSGGGDHFPLGINLCNKCWHTQLTVSVDPKLMFDQYLYVTGTSQTLRDYCDWFALHISGKCKKGSILDIACNDGTQLDSFKKLGWETYGLDPAKNIIQIPKQKGHNTFLAYWPTILDKKFDVITAQNVLAHTPNPLEFLKGCKTHLTKEGKLFVQTSQSQMYQRGEFDTCYHEHISFFSVNSMKVLCERAELKLIDVETTPIHGESYLFTISKSNLSVNESVEKMIFKEVHEGRHRQSFYYKFAKDAKFTLETFKSTVDNYRRNNIPVIGYGAAAKGITVLNANNIQLDWIVDDNPMKEGLFTPGGNIPIKNRNTLYTDRGIVVVPLAWNFFDEIESKVNEIRKGMPTIFIKCFHQL